MRLSGQFIYLFIFYKDILHKGNTQALFKYLNMPKKHNKAHKQLAFRHDAQKHNKAHKRNFHLDITPRNIKNNFSSKYFYALKKRTQATFNEI